MSNPRDYHSENKNDEWYTPADIIEAARRTMGSIDLDPASCEFAQRTVQAEHYFTKQDDGLTRRWYGNVFLNWPYSGNNNALWAAKLIAEYELGNIRQAVAVCNASVDTKWFQPLFAYHICFVAGRIQFINGGTGEVAGSPAKPSAVVYLGADPAAFVREFASIGAIVAPAVNAVRVDAHQVALELA